MQQFQRRLFLLVFSLTPPVIGACSGPNDSDLPSSIARTLGTRSATAQSFQIIHTFENGFDGAEPVLYSFTGGSDGASPFGGVTEDAAGNLYGTTTDGGGYACNDGNGCGTVFKVDATGKATVLHRFTGKHDGMDPMAGVTLGSSGYLYGTTEYGGDHTCDNGLGCGVAFELKP